MKEQGKKNEQEVDQHSKGEQEDKRSRPAQASPLRVILGSL